jgi:hypothetical protein
VKRKQVAELIDVLQHIADSVRVQTHILLKADQRIEAQIKEAEEARNERLAMLKRMFPGADVIPGGDDDSQLLVLDPDADIDPKTRH